MSLSRIFLLITLLSYVVCGQDLSLPIKWQDSTQKLLNAKVLQSIPELKVKWEPISQTLSIRHNKNVLFVSEHLHHARGKTNLLPLKAPMVSANNQLWIPKEVFAWIAKQKNQKLFWKSNILEFKSGNTIESLKVDKKQNGTLIQVKLGKKVKWDKLHFKKQRQLILRFYESSINADSLNRKFKKGLLRSIAVDSAAKTAMLNFNFRSSVQDVIVSSRDQNTILITLVPKKIETTKPTKKSSQIIVIDPGHGGKDSGALGKKYKEKDITLAVGKEIRKLLEKMGYKVKMTRTKDKYIHLQQRPKMASKWKGDLFVSLHCNAIAGNAKRKKNVKGFKAFILREAKSESDRAIARRENLIVDEQTGKHTKKELSAIEWIQLEHQLNFYTAQSEQFAQEIVKAMEAGKPKIVKMATGAGQAGFMVLTNALMPAVLVELGFISNPKEEIYMGSRKGRKDLAKRLSIAIDAYAKELKSRQH